MAVKYGSIEGFERLPLESSISGLKSVALPRHLLDLAVLLFMTGIGLYELFCWTTNAGSDGTGYRNIFIVFIITLGLYLAYSLIISIARVFDDDKRNTEFDTKALGGFRRPTKLRNLEQELEKFGESIGIEAQELEKLRKKILELESLQSEMKRNLATLHENAMNPIRNIKS